MIAAAFAVLLARATPPCRNGMARGRGRGRVSRAEVREDSPGTWETRTVPPRSDGLRVATGKSPKHPGLFWSYLSGALQEIRIKREAGGTA